MALLKNKPEAAEKILKLINEHYNGLIETSADFLAVLDKTGRILMVNELTLAVTGWAKEELVGKTFAGKGFFAGKSEEKALENFKRTMAGQKNSPFELEIIKKDDGIFYGLVRAIPLKIEGEIVGEVAIIHDIGESKKLEEILKENAEKLKLFFDGATDAILVADVKTRKLTDCNKAAEKLLGYSREEILSLTADRLHPQDRVKETMAAFEKQARGIIRFVETEVLTKTGTRIPVEISTGVISIKKEKNLLGVFRDISERRKAEAKLKEKTEELKRLNEFMLGREVKMAELKEKIRRLEGR